MSHVGVSRTQSFIESTAQCGDMSRTPWEFFKKSVVSKRLWAVYVEIGTEGDNLFDDWDDELRKIGLRFERVDPFKMVPDIF
ncbi:hypothetical protein HDU76_012361 [Blyttiomyces sp. JEL0837]|nr:hypothetical protein HDU76_012361 [Blyttiomyces sp. JEL0837]